jgi:hypothetical protein
VVDAQLAIPALQALLRVLHLAAPPLPPPADGPDAPPGSPKCYSRAGVYGLFAQFRTYTLLLLSNALSHPHLARAFVGSPAAVQQLADLLLGIPSPLQQPAGELSRAQPGMALPVAPGTPPPPPGVRAVPAASRRPH